MPPRTLRKVLPLFLLAAMAFAGQAQAADYYVKISGIPGDVTNEVAVNSISVQRFTWGVSTEVSRNAARSTGRPTFDDLVFEHRVDQASPLLFRALATGRRIPSARLSVIGGGGESERTYLEYCLEDVIVRSLKVTGVQSAGVPTEDVTLNAGRVEERYIPQGPDGGSADPVLFGWDLIRNREIGFNNNCGADPVT
jgi:type VI secretion system secreted protein Hcp